MLLGLHLGLASLVSLGRVRADLPMSLARAWVNGTEAVLLPAVAAFAPSQELVSQVKA